MREPLRIWIGWDDREVVAWHVLTHSILSRASLPVAVIPLRQEPLRAQGIYTRERGPTESTAFSLTRFLVPYLSGYWGTSIFCDSDMLCRVDIADLLEAVGKLETQAMKNRKPAPALFCCQHDYTPSETTKFLGNVQTSYPRKNWSSLMVFRNTACRSLTPEYVNTATGLQLHRFEWLSDDLIAPLPLGWNHLVGEYAPSHDARLVHFTTGGPWFSGYEGVEFAEEWFAERDAMLGILEHTGRYTIDDFTITGKGDIQIEVK